MSVSEVIRLRALRLTLRLTGSIQDNAKPLAELELSLPENFERIWFFSIGIYTLAEYMIPWVSSPKEFAAKRQKVLVALGDWDVFEMSGEPACSNPWGSKLERWVDNNLRTAGGWKRTHSKNIPLTERRKPRGTGTV